jgi:hypothetical protein
MHVKINLNMPQTFVFVGLSLNCHTTEHSLSPFIFPLYFLSLDARAGIPAPGFSCLESLSLGKNQESRDEILRMLRKLSPSY